MVAISLLTGRSRDYAKLEERLSRRDEVRESLSLGIRKYHDIEPSQTCRELIMPDFESQDTMRFPRGGSAHTESHRMHSFDLQVVAPYAYRFIRGLNFLPINQYTAMVSQPLQSFESSSASGSFFFRTADGYLIVKSVKSAEARFLRNFLPHYAKHLVDNPDSLLPQFFGLYNYAKPARKIRFIVMNNILPRGLAFEETYDLKGSKYKRRVSPRARTTLKDQNFDEKYPLGFFLRKETHQGLIETLERDVAFLVSMNVIDYSLLLGICRVEERDAFAEDFDLLDFRVGHRYFRNGVVAYTGEMRKVFLFLGVIDVLQSYGIRKLIEKTLKSVLVDTIHLSVNSASVYGERFLTYLRTIFHPFPSRSPRSSPSPSSSAASLECGRPYCPSTWSSETLRVTNIDESIRRGTFDKASIYSGFIVTTFDQRGNVLTENQL